MFNLFWYITGKNRRFYKTPIWIIGGQISNLSPSFPFAVQRIPGTRSDPFGPGDTLRQGVPTCPRRLTA